MPDFIINSIAALFSLFENPLKWYSQQIWIIKIAIIIFFVPLISAISIAAYNRQDERANYELLQQEIQTIHSNTNEIQDRLSAIQLAAKPVTNLTSEHSTSSAAIPAEESTSLDSMSKVLYVPNELSSVSAHVSASTSSAILQKIPPGSLLFINDQVDGWVNVKIGSGNESAWIRTELGVQLLWP